MNNSRQLIKINNRIEKANSVRLKNIRTPSLTGIGETSQPGLILLGQTFSQPVPLTSTTLCCLQWDQVGSTVHWLFPNGKSIWPITARGTPQPAQIFYLGLSVNRWPHQVPPKVDVQGTSWLDQETIALL